MNLRTSIIIIILALSLLPIHVLVGNAQPIANIRVDKKITFKPGYVVVNTTITVLNGSLNLISFRIGDYIKNLVYAGVFTEDGVIDCKVGWDEYYVVLPKQYTIFNIIEVYKLTMVFENATLTVSFPLTITPREASGEVYIEVETPTRVFEINYPLYFNKTTLGAVANITMAEPGLVDVLSISFYQTHVSWVKPISLNRTVVLEDPKEILFIDEYIFENLAGGKAESVTLALPLNTTIKGIEGSTGPYTGRGGDGSYYSWSENDKTMISISFRSPLYRKGERIYLKLTYIVPTNIEDGAFLLPVYHSSGLLLENYCIKIKVAGEAILEDIVPEAIEREGLYKIYKLRNIGLLIAEKPYNPNIKLRASIDASIKWRPYIFLSLFAIILVLVSMVFIQKVRTVSIETKGITKIEATSEVFDQAIDLYAEKTKIYENLISLKFKRLNEEISRQTYKQGLARVKNRLKNINQKIEAAKTSVRKISKKAIVFLEELESEYRALEAKIRELDMIEVNYRRGELSKKAYREKIRTKRDELDAIIAKIYNKIALVKAE